MFVGTSSRLHTSIKGYWSSDVCSSDLTSTGLEVELDLAPTNSFDFAVSTSFNTSEPGSSITVPDAQGVPQVVAGIREGNRSEERRVGKSGGHGGRRIISKKRATT